MTWGQWKTLGMITEDHNSFESKKIGESAGYGRQAKRYIFELCIGIW